MTDRQLAALILVYSSLIVVCYLAWMYLRGFDPSICTSLQVCSWRTA